MLFSLSARRASTEAREPTG
jgi:uncharacterized protein DUF433